MRWRGVAAGVKSLTSGGSLVGAAVPTRHLGVTANAWDGALLAAGNSDTHSQLRVWDLRANPQSDEDASLRDASRCRRMSEYGVCARRRATLIVGTCGWLVHVDLRSGGYEKRVHRTASIRSRWSAARRFLCSVGMTRSYELATCVAARFPLGSHSCERRLLAVCRRRGHLRRRRGRRHQDV